MASRRGLLRRLAGLSGAIGLAGCSQVLPAGPGGDEQETGPRGGSLPDRQHAWNDVLRTDRAGNPIPPRHHTIVLLSLRGSPSADAARTLERAMATLEGAYEWSPNGLLHTLAWGTRYFSRIGELERSPIRRPAVISRVDTPEIQEYDAALVLATDVPSHLTAARNAMFGNRGDLNGEPVTVRLGDVFATAGTRTGFIGEGLPAAHADAEGLPDATAIPEDVPMFTGFFSGRTGTQASEDRVTIDSGPFAGGTTMHLSRFTENLESWWEGLDDAGRVARMFSAPLSPEDVAGFEEDVPAAGEVAENAREYGLVGHQEKVARARRDGSPVVLRRDFNTVDGGRAGIHFVSLQATLDDFVRTRDAMNGWWLRDEHRSIRDRRHNGILEFITERSLANFYVPPRAERAFPTP